MPPFLTDRVSRIAGYFGAHLVPDRARHERDRALQRAVAGLLVAGWWVVQSVSGRDVSAAPWFVGFVGLVLPILAFGYRRFLRSHPAGGVWIQYAFVVLDPIVLIGVLLQDPASFAFMNPLLLVVIVGTGVQYGARTMGLAWGAALLSCSLLATSAFWRTETAFTFAFLLTLALVRVSFLPLVRRIHSARAVEEERDRAVAAHELAVARSAFLAKVSHELRSPLQGIVSALDLIEMRHARALQGDEELIGRMRRSSMLLNTQLRDLLTLAKGEAGRLQMHAEPLEARSLVEALAEAARGAALEKGLALAVDLPSEPVFVVADGARIDQVLTNLVVNSIRYTDAGEVRIAMEAPGETATKLRFVVADTGPGIPQDMLPTLFEPDKFATTPARRGEGSGIGLAIVRTLVEHLGGTLAVASELGKGTRFTVDLPVEPVEAQK